MKSNPLIILSSLLLGLVVVLAAGLLVVPRMIDWNRYKGQIAAEISTLTGREVTLRGALALTLLPTPTLSASDVEIASLPGATGPAMARLGRIDASVGVFPLLAGRVDIESVVLVDPVVTLEVTADGRRTWESAVSGPAAAGGQTESRLRTGDSVRLGGLTIRNGTVRFRDAATGTDLSLGAVDARVAADSLAGPFQVQAGFKLRGVDLRAELVTGRILHNGPAPIRIALSLPATKATARFAGVLRHDAESGAPGSASPDSGLNVQGDLRIEGADFAGATALLGRALGRSDPALSPTLAKPFRLRAGTVVDRAAVSLADIELQLGDAAGRGTARIGFGAVPSADLKLAFNLIDLDPWLAALPTAAPAPPAASGLPGGWCLPEALSGQIEVSVDALSLRGGVIRQARLEAGLADRSLTIDRLAALGPGGSDIALTGTVTGDAACNPALDLAFEANADNLRGLLEWLQIDVAAVPTDRLRKLSLATRLHGRPDQFDLSGFDLHLDTTHLTGGLAYIDRGRPAIGLRLAIDRLNLDAYRDRKVLATTAMSLARSPLGAVLGGFDANIDAGIGSLTAGGFTAEELKLEGTLQQGALTLRQARVGDFAGVAASAAGRIGGIAPLAGVDLAVTLRADDLTGLERAASLPAIPVLQRLGPIDASVRLGGDAARLTVETNLAAAGGKFEAGGEVTGLEGNPGFDLKLRLINPQLSRLIQIVAPTWRPAGGEPGPIDLYARVAGTPAVFAASDLQGTVATMPLRGWVSYDGRGARPKLNADLKAGELVVDRFVSADDGDGPDQGTDLDWLNELDGELALSLAGFERKGERLDHPMLAARLADGVLTVDRLDAGLFGGQLGVTGRLTAPARGTPNAHAVVTLAKADLTKAVGDTGRGDLSLTRGTLDGQADLATTGADRAAMIAALGGTGQVAVSDGAVAGVDLGRISDRLDHIQRPKDILELFGRGLKSGQTRFSSFAGSFRIEGGVVHSDDLVLDADGAHGHAGGSLDLNTRTLDAGIAIQLAHTPPLPALGITLSGPLDHPAHGFDTREIEAYLIEHVAEAAVNRVLPGALGGGGKPADVLRGVLRGFGR
ncbi:MAG: AsmA family protein [Azospirillum sp.]|nr:AsmA family protein [Azospirillum sp.]